MALGKTASGKDIHHTDHEVYSKKEKRPKWNVQVHPLMHGDEGGKILRNRLGSYSKQDHLDAASAHMKASETHGNDWNKKAEEASQHTFKRPYHPTDYRISGVAREEFSDKHKEALRHHAVSKGNHAAAAHAHLAAAKNYRTRSYTYGVQYGEPIEDDVEQFEEESDIETTKIPENHVSAERAEEIVAGSPGMYNPSRMK